VSDLLIGELSRPVADRQIPIMQALGKRKDAAAATSLSQIAQKGDPQARVTAIRTLAEIAPPSAVPLLFKLLSDPEAKVAAAAHEALAAFPGSQADETLLAMVNTAESQGRMAAIDLIELRRTKAALPALKKAAEDPDPAVRRRALEAVGKVGEADDLPFLLARFPGSRDAEDIAVMEAAFSDLGIRSPDREIYASRLIELKGLGPEQRASILRVMGILGGKNAIGAVRSSMKDGTAEVRNAAVRALASWKTPDAAPDLLDCGRTAGEPSENVLCLRGYLRLSSHDELSLDQRVAMAAEAVPLVTTVEQKRMLMSVLQRNPSIRSFSMAAPYLDDPEVKVEASLALTTIAEAIVEKNPTEVRPVMEKILKATENERVTERAKAVLAKVEKILN
jgi:HEAT repeat protein